MPPLTIAVVPPAAVEKFGGIFTTLPLHDGLVSGGDARQVLMTTGLETGTTNAHVFSVYFVHVHVLTAILFFVSVVFRCAARDLGTS